MQTEPRAFSCSYPVLPPAWFSSVPCWHCLALPRNSTQTTQAGHDSLQHTKYAQESLSRGSTVTGVYGCDYRSVFLRHQIPQVSVRCTHTHFFLWLALFFPYFYPSLFNFFYITAFSSTYVCPIIVYDVVLLPS